MESRAKYHWALTRQDILLASLLALIAALTSFVLANSLLPSLFEPDGFDAWFEADLPRIYNLMTSRFAASRATYHPLFHLATFPATKLLRMLGVDPLTAIRLVFAGFSSLWLGTLFLVLRAIGCRRLDAAVFTLLGLCSASAVFFFAAPETFLVGSITTLLALLLVAGDEAGERSPILEAFVSAATLGIAVTNWMFGLLATFYRRGIRNFVQISLNALVICVLLWTFQKYFFPASQFFLGLSYDAERSDHLMAPESEGFTRVLASFFAHSMVMPEIQIVARPSSGAWPILLTQHAKVMSSGLPGDVATAAWAALLVAGAIALATLTNRPRLRLMLVSALAGQLLLHLLFGNETFLYSLHWVPLLVVIAALATMTRARPVVLTLAIVFCFTAGANNLLQFRQALTFLSAYEPLVEQRRESRKSPHDEPWPQQATPVNSPDFRIYDVAAFESGAGLWPATGTFNIGFWITDASGRLITTNHNLSPPATRTGATTSANGRPQINAVTPYYEAQWLSPEHRVWHLLLKPVKHEGEQLFVMLRGVGWDYSRIYSVRIEGADLIINNRWRVEIEPPVEKMHVGTEGQKGWAEAEMAAREVESAIGWGFARIGPLKDAEYKLTITDEKRDGSVDVFLGTLSYANPR